MIKATRFIVLLFILQGVTCGEIGLKRNGGNLYRRDISKFARRNKLVPILATEVSRKVTSEKDTFETKSLQSVKEKSQVNVNLEPTEAVPAASVSDEFSLSTATETASTSSASFRSINTQPRLIKSRNSKFVSNTQNVSTKPSSEDSDLAVSDDLSPSETISTSTSRPYNPRERIVNRFSRKGKHETRGQLPPDVVGIVDMENYVFSHRGRFHYSFESADGTKAYERGVLKKFEDNSKGPSVEGGYSYKDSDGQDIVVKYVADENGFRAIGDHLPTPPPVPPEIARALFHLATKAPDYTDY